MQNWQNVVYKCIQNAWRGLKWTLRCPFIVTYQCCDQRERVVGKIAPESSTNWQHIQYEWSINVTHKSSFGIDVLMWRWILGKTRLDRKYQYLRIDLHIITAKAHWVSFCMKCTTQIKLWIICQSSLFAARSWRKTLWWVYFIF